MTRVGKRVNCVAVELSATKKVKRWKKKATTTTTSQHLSIQRVVLLLLLSFIFHFFFFFLQYWGSSHTDTHTPLGCLSISQTLASLYPSLSVPLTRRRCFGRVVNVKRCCALSPSVPLLLRCLLRSPLVVVFVVVVVVCIFDSLMCCVDVVHTVCMSVCVCVFLRVYAPMGTYLPCAVLEYPVN